jgi:predicted transcriptional regulator
MRFPNLRYGNPAELAYYAMGRTLADIARQLRRDERTVRDWLSGRARVPWWVPEILRLKRLEADLMYRQMFWASDTKPRVHQLGVVAPDGSLERASGSLLAGRRVGEQVEYPVDQAGSHAGTDTSPKAAAN